MKKPSKPSDKLPTTEELNDELFLLVEKSQGFAFISDGMGCMDREVFFEAVRGSYWYALRTAQLMAKFLQKYGQMEKPKTAAMKASR